LPCRPPAPSGCSATTLYRARRLVRPRMGIMLQDAGFPGDLNVTETGRLWAGTLTSPRSVEEALEVVDLRRRARVGVKQLSRGRSARLDLALALLGRPGILFLDEPTAGLDPESRARTWRLVGRLLTSGLTVVLTTHYLGEAEELADRIAILHQGRIVRTGTPAEVTAAQPAHISFVLPPDAPEPVPDLPGAVGGESWNRGAFVVSTTDLQQTIAALLAWASARGLALEGLNARPACLAPHSRLGPRRCCSTPYALRMKMPAMRRNGRTNKPGLTDRPGQVQPKYRCAPRPARATLKIVRTISQQEENRNEQEPNSRPSRHKNGCESFACRPVDLHAIRVRIRRHRPS
jgi:ABC-2 type transport system ATP-binding protein